MTARYMKHTVITVECRTGENCWKVLGEFDTREAAEASARLCGDPGTYRVSRSWRPFVIDRGPGPGPNDGDAP